jgi:hypothetical protein
VHDISTIRLFSNLKAFIDIPAFSPPTECRITQIITSLCCQHNIQHLREKIFLRYGVNLLISKELIQNVMPSKTDTKNSVEGLTRKAYGG